MTEKLNIKQTQVEFGMCKIGLYYDSFEALIGIF